MSSPDLSIPEEENKGEETATEETEADRKRMKLIQLAESGEISQSVKYIKKASNKVIGKLYSEYE